MFSVVSFTIFIYLGELQFFPLVRLNSWHFLFCRDHYFPPCLQWGAWVFYKEYHVIIWIRNIVDLFTRNRRVTNILSNPSYEATMNVGSSYMNPYFPFGGITHVGSSWRNPCIPFDVFTHVGSSQRNTCLPLRRSHMLDPHRVICVTHVVTLSHSCSNPWSPR